MLKGMISIFLLGLSFGAGPCIASCGPILLSYVAGTKKDILKSIFTYTLFSLSRITAYIILCLAVFFFGRFVQERLLSGIFYKIFILASTLFIVLTGVLMIIGRKIEFKFLRSLHGIMLERDNKSIAALGFIMGLVPCVPLLTLFYYVGLVSKTWLHSVVYSVIFGLGTSISPLLILVLLAGFIPNIIGAKEKIYAIFSRICGIIIVILGLQLLVRLF